MNGNLFLDRLTFLSFLKILFFYKNYNILIIDDLKKSNFFFTKLLGLRKNKIKEINFFLGDLKTKDNKNLFELNRSISSRLSFEISNKSFTLLSVFTASLMPIIFLCSESTFTDDGNKSHAVREGTLYKI